MKKSLVAVGISMTLLGAVQATDLVSLAGTWRFALDRQDAGITDRWFNKNLDGRIQLPGALQNQGFGDDIDADTRWTGGSGVKQWLEPKYETYRQPGNIKIPFILQPEKHYVGAAWYQRDIDIPADWQGRRVVLTLERAHWETQVWLDEKPLGTNASLSVPHIYDLGTGLAPGRHRLSIRVDNRLIVDIGARAHSVSDETQGNWNGLIGNLTLSTTSPVWIEDAQVFPDLAGKAAKVKVRIGNTTGKAGRGVLEVGSVRQPVGWSEEGGEAEVEFAIGDMALWDEFNPVLHKLDLKLGGDQADHERELVFGLREIGARERQFMLNGRPVFFRGTLECCIFPLAGHPPTDVESWRRILRICREHGLNHIRFHSWCPPEAAFTAADELGFYYQVEIGAWTTVGDGRPVDQWLYDEAARIIKAYGNHPSFLLMAHGNEPHKSGNRDRWLGGWVNYWSQADPRRLHTGGSGWPVIPENRYHVIQEPRGFEGWLGRDYRHVMERTDIGVPVVVHEMGQWCVYPDFDEIAKYTGPLKPKNFEIFRDSLSEQGMLHQARDFFMASGKLQVLCYKEEIEAALRTPGIGGIQLLDLHDFPGQGTALVGVLDPFWDSKPYCTPGEYRRFYNTTVPLARLMRRTWTNEETLEAEVEIAHFGAAALNEARPYWKVLDKSGRVAASGGMPTQAVPIGQGTVLGTISLPLAGLSSPNQYKLVVGLDGTPYENDWNFWVYPSGASEEPANVLVTDTLDEAARRRLAEGGRVLLAAGQAGVANQKLTFAPVFWNRFMWQWRPEQTLGLLCDSSHPALAQFPTDYFQDWQWHDIITEGYGILMGELPQALRPIVQPIDDWNSNRKLGLVFECRVGRGKLLVCAADLSKKLHARPAARQLRASLLAYAASEAFDPDVEVDGAELAEILDIARPSVLAGLGAKVISFSSQAPRFAATNVLDGDQNSFWHTRFGETSDPMPHHLVFDLGQEVELKGLKYLPRQDMSQGRWTECEVFAGNNPDSLGEAVASANLSIGGQWHAVWFPKIIKARYLKVLIKSAGGNSPFASAAEVDAILAE